MVALGHGRMVGHEATERRLIRIRRQADPDEGQHVEAKRAMIDLKRKVSDHASGDEPTDAFVDGGGESSTAAPISVSDRLASSARISMIFLSTASMTNEYAEI